MQKITVELAGRFEEVSLDKLRELARNGSVDASSLICVDGEIWNIDDILKQEKDDSTNWESSLQTPLECSGEFWVPITSDSSGKSLYVEESDGKKENVSVLQSQEAVNPDSLTKETELQTCNVSKLVPESDIPPTKEWYTRRIFNMPILGAISLLLGIVLVFLGILFHSFCLSDKAVCQLIHNGDMEYERALELVLNDKSVTREKLMPLFQKGNEYWKKAETRGRGVYAGKAARRLGDAFYYGTGVEQNFERATEEYRKGAELGDDFAIYNLASAFYTGYTVKKDERVALEYYKKAAEKQNALAARMLGFVYQEGCEGATISKDQNKANEWFRKAFEWAKSSSTSDEILCADDSALNELTFGRCLYNGLGTSKNVPQALDCFRRSKRGSAFNTLGMAYYEGDGVVQDYHEAVSWFRKAVLLGYPNSYGMLGDCYTNGSGVEKNTSEAIKWYKQGVVYGDGYSCGQLGDIYLEGVENNVQKDITEAIKWFKKGVELQNGYCCRQLGIICMNGEEEVKKDVTEAIQWFKKGGEFQDGYSCFQLGMIYSHSENGVEKNVDEALKWLKKGVDLQDSFSIGMMGAGYYDGSLFEIDYIEAVKWFRKSAELQNAGACYLLGVCYEDGKGVEIDKKEALKWYQKSLELGYTETNGFEAVERLTSFTPSKAAKILDETLHSLEEQYWTSGFNYSILNEDKYQYNDVKANFDSFAREVCAINLNVEQYENLPPEIREAFVNYKNTVVNLANLFNKYSYSGWKTAGVGIATVLGGIVGVAMSDNENASTGDKLGGAATGAELAHRAATSGYESQITNIEKLAKYCVEARDKLTRTISGATNGNSDESDSNKSKEQSLYDKIKNKLGFVDYRGEIQVGDCLS